MHRVPLRVGLIEPTRLQLAALARAGLRAEGAGSGRVAVAALARRVHALIDPRPAAGELVFEEALAAGVPAAAAGPPALAGRVRERFHAAAEERGLCFLVGLEPVAATADLLIAALAAYRDPLEAPEARVVLCSRRLGDALGVLAGAGLAWESGLGTRRRAGGPARPLPGGAGLWFPCGVTWTAPWSLPLREVEPLVQVPRALAPALALLAGRRSAPRPGRGGAQVVVTLSGREHSLRVQRRAALVMRERQRLAAALVAAGAAALPGGPPGVVGPGACPGPAALGRLTGGRYIPPTQRRL